MSVHYNVFETNFMDRRSSTKHPASATEIRQPDQARDQHEMSRALEMAKALQTTLEPEELIEVFATQSGKIIPHDSLRYINEEFSLNVELGKKQDHTGTYQLMINDDSLGKIEFSRATPFSQEELVAFEYLLSSLLYPLRNALLYHQALTSALKDPLTGINNRAAFANSFNREIEFARRHESNLSLLVLDIDYFKKINDQYGHRVGDHVLKEITRRANNCIRGSDMLFRYGGEEFTILLSNTESSGARLLAERIRSCICSTPIEIENVAISCTMSIGIASLKEDDINLTLFDRADKALYKAKQTGRDKVVVSN
jgi:diguanylate cyclase (GGDEF)-like protein